MEKNVKKPHKYSVGDEFKFRITGVREQDGRIVYDIEGLNILSLTEDVVDRFPKLIKPGDVTEM